MKKKSNPMITKSTHLIDGRHERPILMDIHHPETPNGNLVIFSHGYKGFKDWGFWEQVARYFAKEGFIFLKFNFSHNGGTPEQPIDFPDPEAFALNNFTKEMDDLQTVIDWVFEGKGGSTTTDFDGLHLIGHSRGGGIATLKSAEESRVRSVTSWAGVSDFKARFADEKTLAYWRSTGIIHIENTRTGQQLPHYYQFYEDFIANEERFTIKRAVQALSIPHLIIHGTQDPTVDLREAQALKSWNPQARLAVIEGADHVFGGGHPWESDRLPDPMETVVRTTLDFLM